MKLPRAVGWTLLGLIVFALIMVPFALGEGSVFERSRALLAGSRELVLASVIALLALDLLLPIPSSFVSAGSVVVLGPVLGGLAVWVGMTAGALLGYALGASGGRALSLRVVGAAELERAERLHLRFGAGVLAVCRAVPVLAEASTVFAGAVRMSFRRFALVVGCTNAGIALAYALSGGLGSGVVALLLPFALGILVSAGALAIVARLEPKRRVAEDEPKRSSE